MPRMPLPSTDARESHYGQVEESVSRGSRDPGKTGCARWRDASSLLRGPVSRLTSRDIAETNQLLPRYLDRYSMWGLLLLSPVSYHGEARSAACPRGSAMAPRS